MKSESLVYLAAQLFTAAADGFADAAKGGCCFLQAREPKCCDTYKATSRVIQQLWSLSQPPHAGFMGVNTNPGGSRVPRVHTRKSKSIAVRKNADSLVLVLSLHSDNQFWRLFV